MTGIVACFSRTDVKKGFKHKVTEGFMIVLQFFILLEDFFPQDVL